MARLAGIWKRLTERVTAQQIAAGLAVFGFVVFAVGIFNKHCACAGLPNLGDTLNDTIGDFYANVSVDCLSVAFAILVIERLNERRAERELKAQFIREMGSKDNGIALHAVNELRAHGWLEDGSLRQVTLRDANLAGANLVGADLEEARLLKVNLQGADLTNVNFQHAGLLEVDLTNTNLQKVNLQSVVIFAGKFEGSLVFSSNLRGAKIFSSELSGVFLCESDVREVNIEGCNFSNAHIRRSDIMDAVGIEEHHMIMLGSLEGTKLPNGEKYNGRFKLKGDLLHSFHDGVDSEDATAMAGYYGVSLDEYLAGQEWARENLADLRREAGLDPDTGLPVQPTNGTELQPAAASAQPAPRRNNHRHKASMVAHRTRR